MPWRLLAATLLCTGGGLLLWALPLLGWRRWLDLDDAAPDPALPALIFAGPFAVVRHPQSLGLLCVLGAAALTWRRPGMWVLALLGAAVVLALAARDEARQAERFGEAWARYRTAVPFLLPRFR
jgi:protein-S-isoprenylcysteine O-methyltransferase Ste14